MLLTSCAVLTPREEPAAAMTCSIAHHDTPAWAVERINPQWWLAYHDHALSNDIQTAFEDSPDLHTIAARLDQACAQVKAAQAALLPSANLGYGFRFGWAKDPGFDPFELAAWTGSTNFKWEIDLFHKLQRARESAELNRQAVFWELAGAKLVLATGIAQTRFQIYRLQEENEVINEAVAANRDILAILRDREKAGLIDMTEVHRMVAENEKLERAKEELKRLGLIAEVTLDTLRGGRERDCDAHGELPKVPPIAARRFDELVCCHPSLLAAEARLRGAYRMEEVARLDLLPSFTLKGSLMGASPHFFLDEFDEWRRDLGPSLDFPIYDPGRLANLESRRGKTTEAVASYRSTLVTVIGEIDAAYINFHSRRNQCQSASREVRALAEARQNVTANFKAGLVSQVEVLESERSYRQAKRDQLVLEEAVLADHLALIRALGGACCEAALPVTMALQATVVTP